MGNLLWGKYYTEEDFRDGTLIKALNRETGETVALKRMPAVREETSTELRIWRDVYSEEYRGHFTENGILYLERLWEEGENLFDYVVKSGTLGEKRALVIAQKTAEELQDFYCKSGLLHGDVKPENIIVNGDRIRIIDFESAVPERHAPPKVLTSRSRTLRFMTPGFSAPECAKGEQTVKSDIYSLGKVILFMLTGGVASENFNGSKAVSELIEKFTKNEADSRPESMNSVIEMIGDAEPAKYDGVLFKNTLFGYRRLILYVRDNASFSTELAAVAASMGLKVGFYEFCDTGEGISDFYFAEKNKERGAAAGHSYSVDNGTVFAAETTAVYDGKNTEEEEKNTCSPYGELFAETRPADSSDFFDREKLRDFTLNCYSDYDVTVICDSTEINPEYRAQLMRFSDYCILTARPDADEFEEKIRKNAYFAENFAVPQKRLKTVAWEYREGESAAETLLRSAAGETYLGRIEYDSDRRIFRNLKGSFYNLHIPEKIRNQYSDIIGEILPLTQRRA